MYEKITFDDIKKAPILRNNEGGWIAMQQHYFLSAFIPDQKQENLFGVEHRIYQIPEKGNDDFDVVVPEGKYFMMGDNRDASADSRSWGFLPEVNIIGKATRVWMSYDTLKHPVRWDRLGEKII